MAILILVTNLAATLYMTGVIWFVQIVHYPLFDRVGREGFSLYETAHSRLTTLVVAPPMLLELGTALLLLMFWPPQIPAWSVWLGLGLVLLLWLSTMLLQVSQHNILSRGFDSQTYHFLVTSNWLRTLLWSGRSLLILWMVTRVMEA